jgi:predicted nucleic acid-binding protein
VTLVDPAPKAKWVCKDPDDQRFIDLAVLHQATLLSKDQAVLCMAKRLATVGAVVQKATEFTA